jgi:DNA-binding response OmpR family regulator
MNASILLLVSEPLIRKVLAEILESGGYNVVTASGLGDAVDWLKICTPDLLMIRHYTESISGHEAAMNLRRRLPGIPVLMVGGLPDDSRLENRDIEQGFEIFPKPFPAAELLEKVTAVLLKHARRRTTERNSDSG